MRTCNFCKLTKPFEEFNKMAANSSGYRPQCRECQRAATKKYREADPAKVRSNSAASRANNLERARERERISAAKFRAANPEKVKEKLRVFRENNRDKMAAYSTKWKAKDPERARTLAAAAAKRRYYKDPAAARSTTKEWREANPEKVKLMGKKQREKHRDKRVASTAKYKANKRNATPLWADSFLIQEAYHLAMLRSQMTGFKWHVDHTVPINSKKVCGLHVVENLQVIPASINQRKSNIHWPDMAA